LEKVIVDTGALYALVDKSDKWHRKVKDFIENNNPLLIIPCSILPEVCYLVNKYLGQELEITFLKSLIDSEILLVDITANDIKNAIKYMERYKDRNLGFVDAIVLSIAERLRVYRILTIDRRDFSGIKIGKKKLNTFTLVAIRSTCVVVVTFKYSI